MFLQKKQAIVLFAIAGVFTVASCNKKDTFQSEVLSAPAKTPPPTALTQIQQLGKFIYFDNTLSETGPNDPNGAVNVQACASCHAPASGFAALGDVATGLFPLNVLRGFSAGFAEGAVAGKFGGRKAPSSSYTSYSPVLSFKKAQGNGVPDAFVGGMFWDGRASGLRLGSPTAEQALGPFLSEVEHNNASKQMVLSKIMAQPYYASLWVAVWKAPISTATTADIDANYDKVGQSIAAYEASSEINQFSSKYDDVKAGRNGAVFTAEEQLGYTLVGAKGANCVKCHAEKNPAGIPVWTDFGYDNLGLPRNPSPLTPPGPDYGLRNFLLTLPPTNPWYALADQFAGKFKTPSLRNVAKGENLPGGKRFMHNGVLRSLEEVVHFYSTRDIPGAGWDPIAKSGNPNSPNFQLWGAPEVPATMEGGGEVGRIGLTDAEEKAIVAFLRTLSDQRPVLPPTTGSN